MKDEDKLIEVMAELLAEVHEMRTEFTAEIRGLREETKSGFETLGGRVEKLENQQIKTNLALGELRLSVMSLADFGDRIFRLEKVVFNKAS